MNRPQAFFPFRRHFLSVAAVLVLLVPVTFCTSDGTKVSPENTTVSKEIGPEGGVIVGSGGLKLEIPAGALSATTKITLTMYATASSLPAAWAPLPGFRGAVEVEPDGLLFQQPVTLTIPASERMTPWTSFPLFMWNDTQRMWEQTDSLATVS